MVMHMINGKVCPDNPANKSWYANLTRFSDNSGKACSQVPQNIMQKMKKINHRRRCYVQCYDT